MKRNIIYYRSAFLILIFLIMFSNAATVSAGETGGDIKKTRMKMDKELTKITQKWEGKIPQEAYNGDGTVNTEHPGYKKAEAKWRAEMETERAKYNSSDTRWEKMTEAIKKAGVGDNISNTGSQPKSVKSDMDLTASDYQSGKKLVKQIESQGLKATELSDRWIIKKTDTTIWKTPPPETPSSAVSSSAEAGYSHKAQPGSDTLTEGAMSSQTKGAMGIADPEGAVLGHIKKASDHGLVGSPERMDIDTVGKSASKAAEATGTKSSNPDFYGKADGVRSHLTPEEAGVSTFGNPPDVKNEETAKFQEEAKTELKKSYQAGQEQSKQLDTERAQKVTEARAAGNEADAIETRLEQIKTKMSNQATINELPPELAGELTGKPVTETTNPDGSVTYKTPEGKSLSPSQAKEFVTENVQADVIKTANAANEEVNSGTKGMSTGMKVAGGLVIAYGAYEGITRGAEQAGAEEKPGDWAIKSIAKTTIYSVGYASGITDAWETGKKAGEESMNQYEKDKAEGEDPSWLWAKIRGTATGVGTFVKSMTYDPLARGAEAVKEGVGVIGDQYEASKNESQASEAQKRLNAKKVERNNNKPNVDTTNANSGENTGYDPRSDPNMKSSGNTGKDKFDTAKVDKLGTDFQNTSRTKRPDKPLTDTQAPPMQQPDSYRKPVGGTDTPSDKGQDTAPFNPINSTGDNRGQKGSDWTKWVADNRPVYEKTKNANTSATGQGNANNTTKTSDKAPVNKRGPAGSASGTFDKELFNGLQIVYAISGPQLGQPKDSGGFTCTRSFEGQLAGNTFTVSGTGIFDSPAKYDTEYGSFYGTLDVTVSAGKETKNYVYTQPKGAGPMRQAFSVSIPISDDATSGSFSIRVTYVNPRFGNRGVIVSGSLK